MRPPTSARSPTSKMPSSQRLRSGDSWGRGRVVSPLRTSWWFGWHGGRVRAEMRGTSRLAGARWAAAPPLRCGLPSEVVHQVAVERSEGLVAGIRAGPWADAPSGAPAPEGREPGSSSGVSLRSSGRCHRGRRTIVGRSRRPAGRVLPGRSGTKVSRRSAAGLPASSWRAPGRCPPTSPPRLVR